MEMLKKRNMGMILVLKRDKLAGIVTDRDTKRASASASDAPLWKFMSYAILFPISRFRTS